LFENFIAYRSVRFGDAEVDLGDAGEEFLGFQDRFLEC